MANKDYLRVLIRYGGRLYSFINVNCSPRDGSLNLTLRRDGTNDFRVAWSNRPNDDVPKHIAFKTPREKNQKVTIHQSGRINFPDLRDHPIYIEPLAYISKPFAFLAYRIPCITALSEFSRNPDGEDIVIDLSTCSDTAQSFELVIGPNDYMPGGNAVRIEYLHRYALSIVLHEAPLPITAGYEKYFTTHSVGIGLFPQQQLTEDAALISFHQTLHNTNKLIIYAPNLEGIWQIVFSVPTRIAPKATIEPADPNLCVEVADQSIDKRVNKAQLKFKVKNKQSGKVIMEIISFKKIELCAEL